MKGGERLQGMGVESPDSGPLRCHASLWSLASLEGLLFHDDLSSEIAAFFWRGEWFFEGKGKRRLTLSTQGVQTLFCLF